MAKQGQGLSYTARLNVQEAIANAKKLKKELADMGVSTSAGFTTKPMTDYQAGLLKIKQEALEFAKQKQEQARADRAASLATQDALRKEAELIRQRNAEAKKRPVDMGDSQGEINASNASKTAGNGRVASSGRDEYIRLINEDLAAGKISLADYNAEMKRLNQTRVEATKVTKQQGASQKELAKDLAIEKFKLQERNAALKLSVREMMNEKGSLEQRRAALIRLNAAYDRLSVSERNSAAGQRLGTKIIPQLNAQILELERSTGRAQRNVGNYAASAINSFKSIAASLGLAFGVSQLLQFGQELFGIAKKAEGVELAFAKIGDKSDLQTLRDSVRGTVSDLELMALAVRADKFKIPMDVLATGLEFSRQRAIDLGKDVDYMVNSFVDGIGRKSTLVLDNLGISATDLQKEIKKTGDFTIAVGNIMESEMAKSGVAVDTLADKSGRLATIWENLKKNVAGFFNSSKLDTENIANLTKAGAVDLNQSTYATRLKLIEQQSSKMKKLAEERLAQEQKILALERKYGSGTQVNIEEARLRKIVERQLAEKNIYNSMVDQSKALSEQDRLSKGLLSLEELREKAQNKRTEAGQIVIKGKSDEDQIRKLNKEADALDKMADRFSKKTSDRDAREANAALQRAKTLGRELSENRLASLRNQQESDNAELQSVKDSYQKRKDVINAFFDDPKNKGQRIVVDGKSLNKTQALGYVKTDETRDTDLVLAKQAVENTKMQIDAQKQIFNEYEQYKLQVGTSEANRRFAAELKGFKSYVDYLKSLLPDEADQSAYANRMRDLINKDLKPKAELDDKKRLEDEYTALLKSTETYQQASTALTERYQVQRNELVKRGQLKNAEELDRLYKIEMDGLIDHANSKTDLSRRLSEELMVLTRYQINEQIKILTEGFAGQDIPNAVQALIDGLRSKLSIGTDQSNLDELSARENDLINQMKAEADKTTPKFAELIRQLNEIRRLKKGLDSNGDGTANKGLGKFLADLGDGDKLKGTAAALGYASDAALTLSEGLGGVDTAAGYTLDTIGQLAGAASDLGASILSGDPSKIIGSAIRAVGTLFSIGKKVKEMNAAARKEVQDFYAQAISGEREYQDLLKQRALQTIRDNKIVLQGIRDEVALRKSQAATYDKEASEIMKKLQGQRYVASSTYRHGTLFRKAETIETYGSLKGMNFQQLSQLLAQGKLEGDAKALVERLKELEQKGYDAQAAIADLARQTSELFTGTTSDNLTNALADMFRSGKTGAQDLADFFKQSMDDAALSIFKNKVLAAAMEDFYKKFDEAAQSGDELTSDEIATLNGLFTSLTGDALKRFEEFKKITGSDLRGASTSTTGGSNLSGAIKGITADQADLLSGQFGGMRLAQLKTNDLLIEQTRVQNVIQRTIFDNFFETVKIEANTRRTADNTEELKHMRATLVSIERKMDDNKNALAASGF